MAPRLSFRFTADTSDLKTGLQEANQAMQNFVQQNDSANLRLTAVSQSISKTGKASTRFAYDTETASQSLQDLGNIMSSIGGIGRQILGMYTQWTVWQIRNIQYTNQFREAQNRLLKIQKQQIRTDTEWGVVTEKVQGLLNNLYKTQFNAVSGFDSLRRATGNAIIAIGRYGPNSEEAIQATVKWQESLMSWAEQARSMGAPLEDINAVMASVKASIEQGQLPNWKKLAEEIGWNTDLYGPLGSAGLTASDMLTRGMNSVSSAVSEMSTTLEDIQKAHEEYADAVADALADVDAAKEKLDLSQQMQQIQQYMFLMEGVGLLGQGINLGLKIKKTDWGDIFDKIKGLKGSIGKLPSTATNAFSKIKSALSGLGGNFSGLGSKIGKLGSMIKGAFSGLGNLGGAGGIFGKITGALGGLGGKLGGIVGLAGKAGGAIAGLGGTIGGALSGAASAAGGALSTVGTALVGLGPAGWAVGAAIAGGAALFAAWDSDFMGFRTTVTKIGSDIWGGWNNIVNNVSEVAHGLWDNLVGKVWPEGAEALNAATDGLNHLLTGQWDKLGGDIVNTATKTWDAISGGVQDLGKKIWDGWGNIVDTVSAAGDQIWNKVETVWPEGAETGRAIQKGFTDFIRGDWGALPGDLADVVGSLGDTLGTAFQGIVDTVGPMWDTFCNGLQDAFGGVADFFTSATETIGGAAKGFLETLGLGDTAESISNWWDEITGGKKKEEVSIPGTVDVKGTRQSGGMIPVKGNYELHPGEIVTPASLAQSGRLLGGGATTTTKTNYSFGDIHIHVQQIGSNMDIRTVATELRRYIESETARTR